MKTMTDLDAMSDRCYDRGFEAGQRVGPKWLEERAVLLRRIKNQRRELRRLNASNRGLDILVRNAYTQESLKRIQSYRHASQIAETFWFGGRIARAIRKWL